MAEVPELLTEYEVAELLRVQVAVVRRLRKQGRPPPFVMVGNHARYPRSAIFAEDGGSYVFVQGSEGWIKKKVEVGLPSFTMVSIRSWPHTGQ